MATKQQTRRGTAKRQRSWEWRSGQVRRRRDRRRRAVLVETDRRSGLDRREGDRRRD